MNKKELLNLLNKAREYHNYLCDEKEKESFQLITKIIEKWPNHWEAYYLMGLLLFNTNEKMAIENFNKSIKLKRTFDNTIAVAQLLYFLEDNRYKKHLKYAKSLDINRFHNYMKNFWE